MINLRHILRGARLVAVLAAALAISACANNNANNPLAGGAGAQATPGSQQDFVVNVGDRVFFSTDSSDLSAQARATLDKQAQWLSQYGNTPSPSKAMPTSAAPANTTSRSAPAARRWCATTWSRAASPPTG